MSQPPGYVVEGEQVCQLNKTIYGLKESPRVWFDKFTIVVATLGFKRKYVLNLLKKIRMLGCKLVDTPIEPNVKLCGGTGSDVDVSQFQWLVGKLVYLIVTRPYISYSISIISQYMCQPQQSYWEALEIILQYLKKSSRQGLLYKCHGHIEIEDFVDADWVGSPDDRKSSFGYCTILGGNLYIPSRNQLFTGILITILVSFPASRTMAAAVALGATATAASRTLLFLDPTSFLLFDLFA
ncbi:uncharacterized mitochondrial protein AtMg00810-like [Aristolochia californica]|uniref:uncharacterized mitochondrial protein AtMg00810-like n=1 Tax=Aristolochia californica TaxID=171875 RepID=UPI0035E1763F